jgi:lipoprotein-anchoring transpeptidase ErfK/SrfK
MRRICMSALLASAAYGLGPALPAFADPLQFTVSPYMTSQPVYAVQQQVPAAPPQYAVQQQPVAPQQYYAAQPAYTGTVAPRYVSSAPATYAPSAPAAPPPQPAAPANGGGFLAAIFGGPTVQAHVYNYQPAQPEYAAPAPQTTVINSPQGYAPSSQGDMSGYRVDPRYDRQVVDYRGEEKPGTIVIDTPNKFLYLVEGNGKALRYGIGVGRPGFTWSGVKEITRKAEWPDWRPPDDMLARRPDLPRYMPGGVDNPLGARAMYLGSTLYRIHGSNEPWTIGTNVSSGCIRMRNEDVTDLYGRVKVGTKVVVI